MLCSQATKRPPSGSAVQASFSVAQLMDSLRAHGLPKRVEVDLDDPVAALLKRSALVAVGVSGGKDSVAAALATSRHLDAIGHRGARVLVHADLGAIEWRDSLPSCERLARRLDWPLHVVSRAKGGMIERWEQRWDACVARYATLSTLALVLPWSTPSMRFCTSELKSSVIAQELRRIAGAEPILSVSGVRREESTARAKAAVSEAFPRLLHPAGVLTWNSIASWQMRDVLAEIERGGLALHEAYTTYGSSRVSCVCCIMSSRPDLVASTMCADNHDAYRALVRLEARSSFAFQSSNWLADVAPHLLGAELAAAVVQAKRRAVERVALEARLPEDLRFTKQGWPPRLPTQAEARTIAEVRRAMGALLELDLQCLDAESVSQRFAELMAERVLADARRDQRAKKPSTRRSRPAATPV